MKTKLLGHHCDQCEKVFPSRAGLTMHKLRKHSGRGWSTVNNLRGKRRSREERLAKRREYQYRLRERYYAEGRNSKGEPMPPGWKPNPRKRARANKSLAPSKQADYQRRYARKRYAKLKALRNGTAVPLAPAPGDPLGDAAKAVLLAAKVLRGTLTALKLP